MRTSGEKKKGLRLLRLSLFVFFCLLVSSYLGASYLYANAFTTSKDRSLGDKTPATYGLTYENVSFPAASDKKPTLRGWFVPNSASNKVLVLVHGRDATRRFGLSLSKPLWDAGYSLLLFDLEAHGQSDGDHYSFGQREQWDVVGAVNYLKSRGFASQHIGALAWSMGASSTIMAMSDIPDLKTAVSDSAYADFAHLQASRVATYPLLLQFVFPGVLVFGRLFYDVDIEASKPVQAIKSLGDRHLFLIHGEADTTVPVENFYTLKEAGGKNITETWLLPGVEHVQAFETYPQEYISRVTAFFKLELS
ncbi:MAG: prolyl oligopeptidase family serine peptidase [Chloroflexi bacterium]|uniref:Prolyl oligopeptidase family serine peptidase n=1 Tax=Candidatus Chlorohelix allophototropha TaxID=3003348 RepID=A0A8T7M7I7_9CHLR|nr:prolyl oligopeptidase family serine peptidase [Chloroflexota bacterium]WJW69878.1 prolyl oligopeptidase family serine peptidase [Chloroflexota bacterium L227-S17]